MKAAVVAAFICSEYASGIGAPCRRAFWGVRNILPDKGCFIFLRFAYMQA